MRIISLSPSATEIVFALGAEDELVGLSADCDEPDRARAKPVVSRPALEGVARDPRAVDAAVRARLAAGAPLYTLDRDLVRALRPDLILAQDLCRVCAVPSGDVTDALAVLGGDAAVCSLDPERLDDVLASILTVGDRIGRHDAARVLVAGLVDRLARVRARVAARPRVRTLVLEWSDPPFSAGHWVPDMIEAAGGEAVLARAGARSTELAWDQIADAAADVVVLVPCGYDIGAAEREGRALAHHRALEGATQVWAAGDACFSRPGPRLVDGVELLAAIVHPETVPPRPGARRLR